MDNIVQLLEPIDGRSILEPYYLEHLTDKSLEDVFREDKTKYVIYQVLGVHVGLMVFRPLQEKDGVYLFHLQVHRDMYRRGIGTYLLKDLKKRYGYKKVFLNVETNNEAAMQLYKKFRPTIVRAKEDGSKVELRLLL